MYEVTVEADFSSGHYLRNYKGKCENPHGHNYKVRITLAGAELDEAGLLLDFKLLKGVLRPVIDRVDHQMLNDLEPFTELNPSAENIAKSLWNTKSPLASMCSQNRSGEAGFAGGKSFCRISFRPSSGNPRRFRPSKWRMSKAK
jgi:6-pyruvoyltetrahydropterin/6-carboxytetrahydropterin synthase